jgi:hypothetical protein
VRCRRMAVRMACKLICGAPVASSLLKQAKSVVQCLSGHSKLGSASYPHR